MRLIILGVGMGSIFAPAFSTATQGVEGREAGVASAMVNTSQQVGGSVGTSLLSTIFASAVTSYAVGHVHTPDLANAAWDIARLSRRGARISSIPDPIITRSTNAPTVSISPSRRSR